MERAALRWELAFRQTVFLAAEDTEEVEVGGLLVDLLMAHPSHQTVKEARAEEPQQAKVEAKFESQLQAFS
jgi:hypothetical protein